MLFFIFRIIVSHAFIAVSASFHPFDTEVAEAVGFEPTVGLPHVGFQDRCIKPLCHASVGGC